MQIGSAVLKIQVVKHSGLTFWPTLYVLNVHMQYNRNAQLNS